MRQVSFPFAEPLEDRIAPSVFIVSTTADSGAGSLRQAILNANADSTPNASDTIFFQKTATVPLHGTISLKSNLPAIDMPTGDTLTINGPTQGKSNGIIINGGGKHQIISITGGAIVTMTDLTVTHGLAQKGGGVYINDGANVLLDDVTITGNHALNTGSGSISYGGGVFISSASTAVTISNSSITKNVCTGVAGTAGADAGYAYGGGILSQGTLTLQHSIVSGNIAQGGNGETGGSSLSGGGAYGGGIYASKSNAKVTIENNSTITGNKSIGGNGGNGGTSQSGGGGGRGNGGGVYSYNGTVSISHTTISKNIGQGGNGGNGGKGENGGSGSDVWGGGVANDGTGASMTIANSVVSGNKLIGGKGGKGGSGGGTHGSTRGSYGGGVYSDETFSMFQTTLTGNAAVYGGGFYSNGSTSSITSCTFSKNTALAAGGGVRLGSGVTSASIEDSTVALNSSAGNGGGVSVTTGGTIHIYNDTIALNKASASKGSGGGLDVSGTTTAVDVISTIIAGNTAKNDPEIGGTTSNVNASFDLIQNVTAGSFFDAGHNITGQNAHLGSLGLHAGGTTATMVPDANSPALTNGSMPDSNLTIDQNGNSRTGNDSLVDMGSVEVD